MTPREKRFVDAAVVTALWGAVFLAVALLSSDHGLGLLIARLVEATIATAWVLDMQDALVQ
jgi:hypothetical protein